MELLVQRDVLRQRVGAGRPALEQPIDPRQAACACPSRSSGALEPLGGELGRGALEHAADLDAVVDVLDGELGGDESAGRPGGQQALLLQPIEHQPQRRPRHLQPGGQRNLAQPLARAELAAEEEFAHLQERTKSL